MNKVLIVIIFFNNFLFAQKEKDSIDLFLENQIEKFNVPGLAACVIKNDEIIWSNSYGLANIEENKKMSTNGIMNIASVSKTITATSIMQLWEKELIKLDTNINVYLNFDVKNPSFPETPITIRQLLTHSSSIKDAPTLKNGFECSIPSRTLQSWIENYFRIDGEFYNETENFYNKAPSTIREYSNVGYGLLGLIVERVSGQPFNVYCKENIFEPLEMNNTGYFMHEIDSSKIITPYLYLGPLQKGISITTEYSKPFFNPYCIYGFWNYPDGLVRTSVEDLANFTIAYMNNGIFNGKRILESKTIDLMLSPQLNKEINEDQDQGLGWFHSSSLDPSWYHGGSDPGVSTRMYVNKIHKISVIVFQNSNEDNTYYSIRKLYDTFKD